MIAPCWLGRGYFFARMIWIKIYIKLTVWIKIYTIFLQEGTA